MLSEEHENIIDDFRECLWKYNNPQILFVIEHIIAAIIWPELKYSHNIADGYIQLHDGHSVFPLEVGKMKDNKWTSWNDKTDGNSVRVLRISFERNIWLLNPRGNDIENEFISFLRNNGFS